MGIYMRKIVKGKEVRMEWIKKGRQTKMRRNLRTRKVEEEKGSRRRVSFQARERNGEKT